MTDEVFWTICKNQGKWRQMYLEQERKRHQEKIEEMKQYESRRPKSLGNLVYLDKST